MPNSLKSLLPCPWCGADAQHVYMNLPDDPHYRVCCTNRECDAQGPRGAIMQNTDRDKWNTRAPIAEGGGVSGNLTGALERMDALLTPECRCLNVSYDGATAVASRNDMALIRAAIESLSRQGGECLIEGAAISQGNFGQPDGSTVIGWRVSAETVKAMGMSAMCLPKEIGEDLERLRAIASWWETGAKDRQDTLSLVLRETFPDDKQMRRDLWDSILPLIYAIAAPPPTRASESGDSFDKYDMHVTDDGAVVFTHNGKTAAIYNPIAAAPAPGGGPINSNNQTRISDEN